MQKPERTQKNNAEKNAGAVSGAPASISLETSDVFNVHAKNSGSTTSQETLMFSIGFLCFLLFLKYITNIPIENIRVPAKLLSQNSLHENSII